MTQAHKYQDLIFLFNQTFASTENTILVKGADEPIYIPAKTPQDKHQIIFAHGYFASALHEISHWCIAGQARRLLEDYGYWYCPDGRNKVEQAEFEKVEVKPQAIEWAFCVAAKKSFRVSTDNLNGAPVDQNAFQGKVQQQALKYLQNGFPPRVDIFIQVLSQFYQSQSLTQAHFALDEEVKELADV
ncbi:elongation factor P hydroxylase [Paraglaciecola sp. L3A3]|uniref:elongation factor P hydroxylase n=1 Tax=Paraglaciecola sp. L3A3 TaxID=2686358 RepID=UPI00131C6605|nr:elongation factor P hydroxylase [Paraglaciecola sp. L3A3]